MTGIDKRPVDGGVHLRETGVEGDRVMDERHHGGRDKAGYAYAREDATWWAAELGYDVPPGMFGENLATEGLDVTGAVIGERWRIGHGAAAAVVEVCEPRIPCANFAGHLGEDRWVKRFTAHGAPGAYLRVVTAGAVRAGDPVEVVDRPSHGVSVGEVFRLGQADPDRLELLLAAQPDLAVALERAVRRRLSRIRPVA